MPITTQMAATSGRPVRHRYGPYIGEKARLMLPGLMAARESEKDRALRERLANEALAQSAEEFERGHLLNQERFQYGKEQAEKAEDIGLISTGAQVGLLNRRRGIQKALLADSPPPKVDAFYGPSQVPQSGGDIDVSNLTEVSGDYGRQPWYDKAWEDVKSFDWDPVIYGTSGGLIGAGIGRRFNKDWGGIVGGGIGGALLGGISGGSLMDAALGGLAGAATGGLMNLIL